MSIEFVCNGCGRMLRVPDAHAGKQAKCPSCGALSFIPSGAGNVDANPPPPSPELQSGNRFSDDVVQNVVEPAISRGDAENPYSTSFHQTSHAGLPHRGGVILTLGIVGWCCMPVAIVAVVMGYIDLQSMNQGRMDPSGKSLTTAGLVLGIVSVAINVIFMALGAITAVFS